jgi:hypothetical protein
LNASTIFDYEAQPKERVEVCNLCGGSEFATLGTQDRYGYPVRTDGCLDCGLIFLNPRMTKYAYARFYEHGYRPLVSAFRGREINAQTIQPEQKSYAEELAVFLWPHIGVARTLLDVGGSTGVVARHLAEWFGLDATVIDPAPEELSQGCGLELIPGFIEEVDLSDRHWDVITLCQTADHVLDLAGTLRKIRGSLSPDGLFFVDIVDFLKSKESKVDHPYNLTDATMTNYLRRAGFDVMVSERAKDDVHVRYLCR